jgi:phospholipid transport system substrate-binding protein
MHRRLFLGLAAISPVALADGAGALPALAPDRIVWQGLEGLRGFLLRNPSPSPDELLAFLETEIAGHFDFDYMGRWAAGPYHRRLDEEGRERFVARLRRMFLGALARNLGALGDFVPAAQVYPARPGVVPGEVSVPTRVLFPNLPPTQLDFRFYWNEGEHRWRVFDVTANGQSAITYYRAHFANAVRRHGFDHLAR